MHGTTEDRLLVSSAPITTVTEQAGDLTRPYDRTQSNDRTQPNDQTLTASQPRTSTDPASTISALSDWISSLTTTQYLVSKYAPNLTESYTNHFTEIKTSASSSTASFIEKQVFYSEMPIFSKHLIVMYSLIFSIVIALLLLLIYFCKQKKRLLRQISNITLFYNLGPVSRGSRGYLPRSFSSSYLIASHGMTSSQSSSDEAIFSREEHNTRF